jgi:hypothetical protein
MQVHHPCIRLCRIVRATVGVLLLGVVCTWVHAVALALLPAQDASGLTALNREIAALRSGSSLSDPEVTNVVFEGTAQPGGIEHREILKVVSAGSTRIGSRWVGWQTPFRGSAVAWDLGVSPSEASLIPAWSRRLSTPDDDPERTLRVAFAVESGWPARALGAEVAFFLKYPASVSSHSAALLWSDADADPRTWPFRVIPLRILWPGFVANTLCWVALIVVYRVVVELTRFFVGRRRAGGRCAGCGYLVLDLASCPECGSPATPSSTAGLTDRSCRPPRVRSVC